MGSIWPGRAIFHSGRSTHLASALPSFSSFPSLPAHLDRRRLHPRILYLSTGRRIFTTTSSSLLPTRQFPTLSVKKYPRRSKLPMPSLARTRRGQPRDDGKQAMRADRSTSHIVSPHKLSHVSGALLWKRRASSISRRNEAKLSRTFGTRVCSSRLTMSKTHLPGRVFTRASITLRGRFLLP